MKFKQLRRHVEGISHFRAPWGQQAAPLTCNMLQSLRHSLDALIETCRGVTFATPPSSLAPIVILSINRLLMKLIEA